MASINTGPVLSQNT